MRVEAHLTVPACPPQSALATPCNDPPRLHSLGHGVGLAVHEIPYIASLTRDDAELEAKLSKCEGIEANTIITIEPGVYMPAWGGVRLAASRPGAVQN